MDNNCKHEVRNALTAMAGIVKERRKLTLAYDKRMSQLASDYLKEMKRLEEAQKCIALAEQAKED